MHVKTMKIDLSPPPPNQAVFSFITLKSYQQAKSSSCCNFPFFSFLRDTVIALVVLAI